MPINFIKSLFPLIIIFFSYYSVWAEEPDLIFYPETVQGGTVQFLFTGGGAEDMVISLQNSKGSEISSTKGFEWTSADGKTFDTALLGIPPSVAPGDYIVYATGRSSGAYWKLVKKLNVREKDFDHYTMVLSDKMNAIYSDNSKQKKEEAQKLWSVLLSFNKNDMFFTESFENPVRNGVTTSPYGQQRTFLMPEGAERKSIHFGSDLWAPEGTPVHAAGRGKVVLAEKRIITGNTVVLEHLPGVYTLYYHLDSINVKTGEIADIDNVIGTLGKSGFATGEHLHWEMRVNGVPVDPMYFLEHPLLDISLLISNM